jgi:hypothetical protein
MLSGKILKDGRVSKTYNGSIDCIKILYKENGIKVFYKGMIANIYRSTGKINYF